MREPLSDILTRLVHDAEEPPRTLNCLLDAAGRQGMNLVIVVLALPFCLPILPGVSTPFGFAIILLSAKQLTATGGRLPKFIGDREWSEDTFDRIISGGVRILERIDRFSSQGQRRLSKLVRPRLNAFLILFMGVLMALPIPFPGTNTFPAWAIVFLATAQAEQDGILVLWGYASILVTFIWFGVFGTLMWTLTMASYEYLGGLF